MAFSRIFPPPTVSSADPDGNIEVHIMITDYPLLTSDDANGRRLTNHLDASTARYGSPRCRMAAYLWKVWIFQRGPGRWNFSNNPTSCM